MKKALFAGSFDPLTNGHVNIIERAAKLFDRLYVVVAYNYEKDGTMTPDERVETIKESLAHLSNVVVVKYSGLIAEFAASEGISTMIRGIRNSNDAQYEIELSLNNKYLNNDLDTIFFPAEKEYLITSSSQIRQFAHFGVDVSSMIPEPVHKVFIKKYNKSK